LAGERDPAGRILCYNLGVYKIGRLSVDIKKRFDEMELEIDYWQARSVILYQSKLMLVPAFAFILFLITLDKPFDEPVFKLLLALEALLFFSMVFTTTILLDQKSFANPSSTDLKQFYVLIAIGVIVSGVSGSYLNSLRLPLIPIIIYHSIWWSFAMVLYRLAKHLRTTSKVRFKSETDESLDALIDEFLIEVNRVEHEEFD
jgi:hypothetical protein